MLDMDTMCLHKNIGLTRVHLECLPIPESQIKSDFYEHSSLCTDVAWFSGLMKWAVWRD